MPILTSINITLTASTRPEKLKTQKCIRYTPLKVDVHRKMDDGNNKHKLACFTLPTRSFTEAHPVTLLD